ncbi:hypothetical protein [Corynebacterium sp. HMSC074A09]|uniref:hypothetical protein n=1 Tax=Corynebacterium sp. HMSC074A09 TaxID=1739311 RepID=UPI001E5E05F8|nr:hypothetical protein [Corynebacterium sp. HMSC074A09]
MDIPFKDESSFKDYWKQNGAEGSYQARRQILSAIFDPFERHVEGLEDAQLQGKLASPVSPRDSTGWVRIDTEIKELREKFAFANTQSDFSDVGNRVVRILDELNRVAFDETRHLRDSDDANRFNEGNSKNRLERVVDVELPGRNKRIVNCVVLFVRQLR